MIVKVFSEYSLLEAKTERLIRAKEFSQMPNMSYPERTRRQAAFGRENRIRVYKVRLLPSGKTRHLFCGITSPACLQDLSCLNKRSLPVISPNFFIPPVK